MSITFPKIKDKRAFFVFFNKDVITDLYTLNPKKIKKAAQNPIDLAPLTQKRTPYQRRLSFFINPTHSFQKIINVSRTVKSTEAYANRTVLGCS